MLLVRHSATAALVSIPSPSHMALATTAKRCRNLYTKQNENSACWTAGPTRKMPGVAIDSSSSVSRGASPRHPRRGWFSSAKVNRCRAAAATLPSKPVHRTGGWGVCRTRALPGLPGVSAGTMWERSRRGACASSSSVSDHAAETLNPPFSTFVTLTTRSGAKSWGFGLKPGSMTSRRRPAVKGASSVLGSAVLMHQQGVDARTLHFFPALARFTAASTPLS
mmetsp:Transcript_291/g.645  ORF Transcript_291/g.645 Transcript_291/m.645 type:complete len:222 (+) Transcript_291:197-862(+)